MSDQTHFEIRLPNVKFRNQSILKAFADEILNVVQMMICVSDWVENVMGNGENAGYQHFHVFPQYFQKPSFTGSLKVWIVWESVKRTIGSGDKLQETVII